MAISGGTRLGPYEVLAFIGAGGMSEVYKARDTRFGRIVAIKVLHEHLAGQADRRARFEREARAISRLNHPTICTLFDAGHDNGIDYVVVEYLEGQSLAERLEKGALPIDQALAIARDVASALDAAHRAGIVHRDVKPANIMITKTGAKLLDFGVATISMSAAPAAFAGGAEPTLTVAGMLLGTVPYMSPEQLEGREADARSDLFAFGAVIYEMIVGKKAFEGTSQASVIHAILDANPPAMSTVLPQVPPLLDHVVTSCLAKDPDHRWQNANDLGRELKWIADATTVTPSVPSAPPGRRRLAAAVIVLTATTVAGTIGWFAARSMVAPSRVSRLHLIPPSTAALSINTVSRDVALTPDGSRLIYIGANGRTLFVRPLDQLEATPLVSGAGELRDPFVSPDGQWVGFFDGGQALKKVPLTGGHAVLVARLDTLERGATFAADGSIIFATSATAIGLQRVSAGGGAAAILTRPDRDRGEANHWWPEVLPGGQTVLYTATETTGGLDAASIAVLDLKTGRSTILLRGGTHAHYAASGHLVFAAGGMLRAVGFDRTHLMTVGTSIPVVPQVLITSVGAAEAAMALDGTLAYVAGSAGSGATRTLVWVDRQGHETPLAAPLRGYLQNPRVSPDGTRVAVADYGQNPAIWLWDLARATLVRLTFDSAFKQAPLWTSNSRVVFDSNPTGTFNLFSRGTDGTGEADRLTESPNVQIPTGVSPDGTRLIFTQVSPKTSSDVMMLRLDGTHQIVPLVQTPFSEGNGIVSPDGRWLAYQSNNSGPLEEIYVRPFPDVTSGPWQVSTNGGTRPMWAPNGHELFYVARDGALMRVAVTGGPRWTAGAPTKLLDGRYSVRTGGNPARDYDITPDGQRFLMLKEATGDATAPPQIVIVQHFDEELKHLVPTK